MAEALLCYSLWPSIVLRLLFRLLFDLLFRLSEQHKEDLVYQYLRQLGGKPSFLVSTKKEHYRLIELAIRYLGCSDMLGQLKRINAFSQTDKTVPRAIMQWYANRLFKSYNSFTVQNIGHDQVAAAISRPLTVVCISDTQNARSGVPLGDLLLHTGNLSQNGTQEEIQSQLDWLSSLPHQHKVIILGDRDTMLFRPASHGFDYDAEQKRQGLDIRDFDLGGCIVLNNSGATLNFANDRQIIIYGIVDNMPNHPYKGNQLGTKSHIEDSNRQICKIPTDVDILMTTIAPRNSSYTSPILFDKRNAALATEIARVKPRLVVFRRQEARTYDCRVESLVFDRVRIQKEAIEHGTGGFGTLCCMYACVIGSSIYYEMRQLPMIKSKTFKPTTFVNAATSSDTDEGDNMRRLFAVIEL